MEPAVDPFKNSDAPSTNKINNNNRNSEDEDDDLNSVNSSVKPRRGDNLNNLVDSLSHMFCTQDVQRAAKLPKKYDNMVMTTQTSKKRQRQASSTSNNSSKSSDSSSLSVHNTSGNENLIDINRNNDKNNDDNSFVSYSEISPDNVLTKNDDNVKANNNNSSIKNAENNLIKKSKTTGKGKKRLKLEIIETPDAISTSIQKQTDENLSQRSRNLSSGSKENETEVKVNLAVDGFQADKNSAMQAADSHQTSIETLETKLRRSRSSTLNSKNDLCPVTSSKEIKSINQEQTTKMYAFYLVFKIYFFLLFSSSSKPGLFLQRLPVGFLKIFRGCTVFIYSLRS